MQIEQRKGWVVIDGRRLAGQITERACQQCGQPLIYSDKFDAGFCAYDNSTKSEVKRWGLRWYER